jgi:hypothetical protein
MTALNWTNVTSVSQILGLPNTVTNGWFYAGVLVMIWAVIMLALLFSGFEIALLASTFIAFLLSVMLYMMGLVASWIVMVPLGVLLITILGVYITSTRENV